MKTLIILALLAFTAVSANATTSLGYGEQGQEQQQQPFPDPQQQQQPFTGQQPFPHTWQQPIPPHQQQPLPPQWQQPYPEQQLNPCKKFLQQQCSSVPRVTLYPSQMLQQFSCQVVRQQCCRELAQIPVQFRYQAIQNVVHTIIMQQQPQQGQGFFHPQQLQFQALQTLSTVCKVNVPPPQFGGVSVGIGGH